MFIRGRVKLGADASGEGVCGDRGFGACQHAYVRVSEMGGRGGRAFQISFSLRRDDIIPSI